MKTVLIISLMAISISLFANQSLDTTKGIKVFESLDGLKYNGTIVKEDEKCIVIMAEDSSIISLVKDELVGYPKSSDRKFVLHNINLTSFCKLNSKNNGPTSDYGLIFTFSDISVLYESGSCSSGSASSYGRWEWVSISESWNCNSFFFGYNPRIKDFSIGLYGGLAQVSGKKNKASGIFLFTDHESTLFDIDELCLSLKLIARYNFLDFMSCGIDFTYYSGEKIEKTNVGLILALNLRLKD